MKIKNRLVKSIFASVIVVISYSSTNAQNVIILNDNFITNLASGLCLDVAGEQGVAPGTAVGLAPCEFRGVSANGKSTDQKWKLEQGGYIVNSLSNLCLDVRGKNGKAPGTAVDIAPCEFSTPDDTDQRWYINPAAPQFIVNVLSEQCLDVVGRDPQSGSGIDIAPCEVGEPTDQQWQKAILSNLNQ